jgi:hypothetical protein
MNENHRFDCEGLNSNSVGTRRLDLARKSMTDCKIGTASEQGSMCEKDAQQAIVESNLFVFSELHSNMVQRRKDSGLTASQFGSRAGLTTQGVTQFEVRPWESNLSVTLLYLMGVGIATKIEIDLDQTWSSTKATQRLSS